MVEKLQILMFKNGRFIIAKINFTTSRAMDIIRTMANVSVSDIDVTAKKLPKAWSVHNNVWLTDRECEKPKINC